MQAVKVLKAVGGFLVDDLEFRKKAVIDPDSLAPEFLEKIKQNQNNHHFVKEQQLFNQKLLSAMAVPAPENLTDRILLAQQLGEHKRHKTQKHQKQWRNWLGSSVAASLIFVLSLYYMLPQTLDSTLLVRNVLHHVIDDTHALNVRMNVPKTSIDTMLASYGGKLNGPIGRVSFLGHCIIGGHTGIHMVLQTSQSVVTVLLLPSQNINKPSLLNDQQLKGIIYPSQKGSVAIVSEDQEAIEPTRKQIDQNLNWII